MAEFTGTAVYQGRFDDGSGNVVKEGTDRSGRVP